jgi:hypothetical protein
MRSQPHQAQDVCIRFLIDQNEVRLYVAVPVIFPVANQGVKVSLECAPVLAFGLALVIPFELTSVVRRPL